MKPAWFEGEWCTMRQFSVLVLAAALLLTLVPMAYAQLAPTNSVTLTEALVLKSGM
jgi:hypothetical protein